MAKVDMKKQEFTEQENILLKKRINELESAKSSLPLDNITDEIKRIKQKGRSTANTIQVKEYADHKNITLWTKDGVPIGPLHPDNAIQTLHRFADIGIVLSADRPTAEQVEAYKQTNEYKEKEKAEIKRRKRREGTKRAGAVDRLIATLEKTYGLDKSQINSVKQPHEVGN